MVYARRRRGGRTNRRRMYKRKRVQKNRLNRTVTTTVRGGTGIPDRIRTKLVYCERYSIAGAGAGISAAYAWNGNSLYDPDYTGVGHQPLYRDQYAGLYNKYKVNGCKIEIWYSSYSATGDMQVILLPDSAPLTSGTTISQTLEQKGSTTGKVVALSGYTTAYQKKYCSTRKALGLTKAEMSDPALSANMGANAARPWYWSILMANMDTASTVNAQIVVRLTYYVEMYDCGIITQS